MVFWKEKLSSLLARLWAYGSSPVRIIGVQESIKRQSTLKQPLARWTLLHVYKIDLLGTWSLSCRAHAEYCPQPIHYPAKQHTVQHVKQHDDLICRACTRMVTKKVLAVAIALQRGGNTFKCVFKEVTQTVYILVACSVFWISHRNSLRNIPEAECSAELQKAEFLACSHGGHCNQLTIT